MRALGMDERVPHPFRVFARRLVNQLRALFLETRERGVNVVYLEADVMHALAALGEIFRKTALRVLRFDQFYFASADRHERDLGTSAFLGRDVIELHSERVGKERERRVDVLDGNADVINPCDHGILSAIEGIENIEESELESFDALDQTGFIEID